MISNILKACVELMAGSDCAMQAKAHMGAQGLAGGVEMVAEFLAEAVVG